jgi:anti-sigma regulatory factor (Ser/Thr protein kinase)
VAIVVVRTAPVRLQVEERTFQAEPIMVSEARRMAAETFASWGMLDEQSELACLLVSEVVTNVVLHAANTPAPRRELVLEGALTLDGPAGFDDPWDELPDLTRREPPIKEFTLRLRRGERSIWVEVLDKDLRLPRIRSAGETDEGGRGLYLVDQLAARWGSRPTNDGKAVWFEIPLKS